ncbi:MAG: acyl-CoA thioesterase [Muribaculaceae bacterium]|nr:acyl-CoA thioesterase [Muribaculaceae bacterium]
MINPGNYLRSDNPRVPMSPFPFRQVTPIQVRFTDCDMLGHINNNMFMAYLDLGKIEYFKAVIPDFNMKTINVAVVNVNADFFAQAFFGEPIEVWTAVSGVGRSSFVIEQRVINSSTGQTKCVGHTTMAAFDPATATSVPLRDDWVHAIERFERRTMRG